jgi:RNA polymerase sigma-70 factor (ECF subfamily)
MRGLSTIEDQTVSEEALVHKAQSGARSAFTELVSRYQHRVHRLATRMSRSLPDAEEITQETFLRAHRGIASFQGESRFSTWLYRIAVNQALMHRRAMRRRPVHMLEELALSGGPEPVATANGEPAQSAEDLIDRKARWHRLRDALEHLEEPHRSALVLRDLEELSAEEAGQVLGVSADVVRQRAHRARLKLREHLMSKECLSVSID